MSFSLHDICLRQRYDLRLRVGAERKNSTLDGARGVEANLSNRLFQTALCVGKVGSINLENANLSLIKTQVNNALEINNLVQLNIIHG